MNEAVLATLPLVTASLILGQMASTPLRRLTHPPPRAGRVASLVNHMMPHDAKG
jgi:hypothetical protein